MTNALAVSNIVFDQAKIDLIKRNICKGATDDELRLFMLQAERTGLDPFSRQIYSIRRKEWDRDNQTETWKHVTQVSIDGFRLVAERTGQYAGQTPVMWCGEDGKWVDVWLKKEPPAAAKAGVLRRDFTEPLYAVATFSAYAQTTKQGDITGMWKKMPALMLGKCAEALALRKAFPMELSGLYTTEEMSQADQPLQPQRGNYRQPADVIEAEVSEQEMEPERQVSSGGINNLKELLETNAKQHEGATVNGNQRALVAGMIEVAFAGEQNSGDKRRQVMKYLTGMESILGVPAPMVKAMLDWLKPERDSGGAYKPDHRAIADIVSIYNTAQIAAGQQEFPL